MPETLDRPAYLDALRAAAARLEATCREVELTTPVPTCPRWDVHQLVQHLGGVHRWATAQVSGVPGRVVSASITEWFTAPEAPGELADWIAEGAAALVTALTEASDERAKGVFLHDPPAPVLFWARFGAQPGTTPRQEPGQQLVDPVGGEGDADACLGRRRSPAEPGGLRVECVDRRLVRLPRSACWPTTSTGAGRCACRPTRR